MREAVKHEWVRELRVAHPGSQCIGVEKKNLVGGNTRYCAIGLLGKLYEQHTGKVVFAPENSINERGKITLNEESIRSKDATERFARWLGVPRWPMSGTEKGYEQDYGMFCDVIDMNDRGETFTAIADVVEARMAVGV